VKGLTNTLPWPIAASAKSILFMFHKENGFCSSECQKEFPSQIRHGMLYPQSFPCQAPSPAGRTPHCLTPQGPSSNQSCRMLCFRVSYFPSVNNYRTVVIKHFTFQSFLNGRGSNQYFKSRTRGIQSLGGTAKKRSIRDSIILCQFSSSFFAWGSKFGLLAKARTSPF